MTAPLDNAAAGWNAAHGWGSAATVVLGRAGDLPAVLARNVVDEVVVVTPLPPEVMASLVKQCAARGVVVRVFVDLPSPPIGGWFAEVCGDDGYLISLATVPQDALQLFLKRAIDLAGAVVGLVLCALVWCWYGLRLKRETAASVLFHQRRVGRNGRRFTLHKFRTMGADAEARKAALKGRNQMRGPMFKLSHDPRVTPTGSVLRSRHLDELPQFWNVLRGEMSLVGTRPPTEDEVLCYETHHHRRLSMKPGITGLWQLSGNETVRDFEDVVKLDCEYIDNWSLLLDLSILARTIAKVFRGDGW